MSLQDVAPDGVLAEAITTVQEQMDKINEFADKYQAQISASLEDIKNVQVDVVEPPRPITLPEVQTPAIDLGEPPLFNQIGLRIPDSPVFNSIDHLLQELDLSDLQIPAAPEFPAIQLPEKPGFSQIDAPIKPVIDTDIQLPVAPALQLPELENLIQIKLPEFKFPVLPDFDGQPPSIGNLMVPNVFVDWREPEYKSELLTDIQAKVSTWLQGGTGIPEVVEAALFNRAQSRQSKMTDRAVKEAVSEWASRDFTLPPGALNQQVAAIREEGRLQAAELNRDIMIEAAKWEIENIRFAVQQGISLEQLTVNIFSNTVSRLFETARFNAESQINVFNSQIALFNAQNDSFRLLSEVFKTKLEGALAKLTAYKAAVDGQVAIGQINEQYVQVYRAKVEGVLSNVELYKALVQGASARADVIKNQFDAYRTEVQAFGEKINAEKLKVDAYEAETRAETSKVNMFDASARAYASTVQAINAKADVKAKQINLKMEAARTWISKYTADLDGYKANLQASMNEVQANTSAFGAQVDAWQAGANANIANAEMQSRYADMNTRTNIAYSEMQMKEYEAKIQKAIQEAQIALEAAKAMGQYTAQLAAGAMSAAHVSASISGSGSTSSSTSKSTSTSTSHNYSY